MCYFFPMATRDVRKESPEVIQELRNRAIELKKKGHTHGDIAGLLDVSVAASRLWWRLYREGGQQGIQMEKRGRPAGACRILSPRQEKLVRRTIEDKTPEQLKLDFALWTRPVIRLFIHEKFGILLPVRTLGHYLKRWGFTPQRPKRVAYERDPGAVRQWLEVEYPRIRRRAAALKAEILWGDETGLSNQANLARGYALQGKTPEARGLARKVSASMISAIGNRGEARFMVYKGGLNTDIFIGFLKRLIKGAPRKILLIVDNLRVHKAKVVKEWVEEHKEHIELHYLPPYSPELNPDEYLNNTLKGQLRNRPASASQRELEGRVRRQMQSNQRRPDLIRSLFQHPSVAYAA